MVTCSTKRWTVNDVELKSRCGRVKRIVGRMYTYKEVRLRDNRCYRKVKKRMTG